MTRLYFDDGRFLVLSPIHVNFEAISAHPMPHVIYIPTFKAQCSNIQLTFTRLEKSTFSCFMYMFIIQAFIWLHYETDLPFECYKYILQNSLTIIKTKQFQ